MRGTFNTTEIVNLLNHRVPRHGLPQFRLQNFLLGDLEWRTSSARIMHIGEAGEIKILEKALGLERREVYDAIYEAYRVRVEPVHLIFPNRQRYREFSREVVRAFGKTIELETLN